jgi:hypothetical protein
MHRHDTEDSQHQGRVRNERRAISVSVMDLPGQQSRESPPRLRVVVPMVFSRSEEEGEEGAQGDETFRQLLVRIKDLLVREGLEIGPSDLEAYTRFVSPHGDIYLLDTSVRDCLLPDAPELRMVTDQHLNLKRKREDAAAAPAAHPAANLVPHPQSIYFIKFKKIMIIK